jgi:hypothetical protein
MWSNWWNENWQYKLEYWENSVPVPLRPPQIPHDLTRARTQTAAMGNKGLIAWATALPKDTTFSSTVQVGGDQFHAAVTLPTGKGYRCHFGGKLDGHYSRAQCCGERKIPSSYWKLNHSRLALTPSNIPTELFHSCYMPRLSLPYCFIHTNSIITFKN